MDWSTEQEDAFIQLKQSLTADTVIAYFDPSKEIRIIVDASPVGLGAMLEHDGRVVAFASRALTDTESDTEYTEHYLTDTEYTEHYVIFIAETSTLPAMSLEEVKSATSQDKTLMKAIECVRNGLWFEIKSQ